MYVRLDLDTTVRRLCGGQGNVKYEIHEMNVSHEYFLWMLMPLAGRGIHTLHLRAIAQMKSPKKRVDFLGVNVELHDQSQESECTVRYTCQ